MHIKKSFIHSIIKSEVIEENHFLYNHLRKLKNFLKLNFLRLNNVICFYRSIKSG